MAFGRLWKDVIKCRGSLKEKELSFLAECLLHLTLLSYLTSRCALPACPWWRHQMETFPRYWPFVRGIHRSPVNSPHKGQWRGALMFSLICVWINGWVKNGEAGDLRRYRAHYDVTVMSLYMLPDCNNHTVTALNVIWCHFRTNGSGCPCRDLRCVYSWI